MLKSLLFALAMGTGAELQARVEELERLRGGLVSNEALASQKRTFGLLAELNRIARLGAKLGPSLLGDSEDSFDEGLADLHDDDKFAELLGRIARLAITTIDQPTLTKRLDTSSRIASRFAAEVERLGEGPVHATSDFIDVISEMRNAAPTELGRTILDVMYDPAATSLVSDAVWAFVRLTARAIVIRHVDANGAQVSGAWSTGLFKDSKADVERLATMVSRFFDSQGQIQYMIQGYRTRANRDVIDEVMYQLSKRPEAWAEHFGTPPAD